MNKQKLTLDQQVPYEIKVPGKLDMNWSDWAGPVSVKFEQDENALPITVVMGTFDQAALQGFLRKLYSLGLPLISVITVDAG